MFEDKVFQTMAFSRHMQEASHCYENFGLEWSFKYFKNTMVSSKLWYSKQSFLHASQTPPWKKYHGILQYHDFVSKLLKYFVSKHPLRSCGSKSTDLLVTICTLRNQLIGPFEDAL
jgi:hypothetical protein